MRKSHPHLKMLIVEDALYGDAPNIKLLNLLGYLWVIGVKEQDHEFLFNAVQEAICLQKDEELEYYDPEIKRTRGFRFINQLPLNKSNQDVLVNFLEYWECDKDDNIVVYFTWITEIELTKENVFKIMKVGRSRWIVRMNFLIR